MTGAHTEWKGGTAFTARKAYEGVGLILVVQADILYAVLYEYKPLAEFRDY